MKCPKCGSHKAKYLEKKDKKKPRTNFKAKCGKCKFEFDAREYFEDFVVDSVIIKGEKKKPTKIKMKYDEGNNK